MVEPEHLPHAAVDVNEEDLPCTQCVAVAIEISSHSITWLTVARDVGQHNVQILVVSWSVLDAEFALQPLSHCAAC